MEGGCDCGLEVGFVCLAPEMTHDSLCAVPLVQQPVAVGTTHVVGGAVIARDDDRIEVGNRVMEVDELRARDTFGKTLTQLTREGFELRGAVLDGHYGDIPSVFDVVDDFVSHARDQLCRFT
ncbi:hypothetical protein ENSA7_09420 [Enhygromyxa salina]|uniref:Uncharacterized protein n=1 Tax=Enhygromyxa salina TaxID=215803 RepID=A0A2S9YW97_9BACT|nr:hypothetical protein ENSA7_09420 [Enhygromyxa salina]